MEQEDKIFKNDPLYMKSLIGKTVSVRTVENKSYEGIVYVIDPIYKNIVLVQEKHPNLSLEIIFHHAIKALNILSDTIHQDFLKNNYISPTELENAETKKEKLRKWLEHMFIKVEEDGEFLKVDDHLIIAAPYRSEDCFCDNVIILKRIRNIIGLMPDSFQ